jgi:hypothetical protein
MKKIILLFIVSYSLLLVPSQISAGAQPTNVINENTTETERVNVLLNRLYELRSTDKSTLTRKERKELRNELRVKKAELQEGGGRRRYGGVYISGTAIIIIILLIILL